MAKKRTKFVDDGRVIASMNVEGMPWYAPKRPAYQEDVSVDAQGAPTETSPLTQPVKMTRRESIAFASGVIKAVLLMIVVFMGGLFLFILFCTNIWLK